MDIENKFEKINIEEDEFAPIKELIIIYLKEDDISEIQILNKNKMICDGLEYQISDYNNQINEKIKKINDGKIDLTDENKYDCCWYCKEKVNEYFCENCHKNICKNCCNNYHEEHKTQSLKEMKVKFKDLVSKIRNILMTYIIPIKEEENIGNKNGLDIKKENKDNNDILLIYDIVSLNYNNYFHYKNIEKILNYCLENYTIAQKSNNYNGKGKIIFFDGTFFIGQFKNHLANGKGIEYYRNGIILYEGDFSAGKREGTGKYLFENGSYYEGQMNVLPNGKGTEYDKNGNIKYEGNYVNGQFEGDGKYIFENGKYYIGQFKDGMRHGKGIDYYKNEKIEYKGDYIDGKREGDGKYISKNGSYYKGQFKNNLPNGKE